MYRIENKDKTTDKISGGLNGCEYVNIELSNEDRYEVQIGGGAILSVNLEKNSNKTILNVTQDEKLIITKLSHL